MPDETRRQEVKWQPISALPLIASMIDGLLDEVEKQYTNLQACRSRPHVLDNHTVHRVIDCYTAQSGDVELYEEQLSRWKSLNLTPSQLEQVNRLAEQIPTIKERIAAILALAEELKGGTIETILAGEHKKVGDPRPSESMMHAKSLNSDLP